MRMKKKKKMVNIIILLALSISIGYALINSKLQINGLVNVTNASWDIHFENVQINSGSVVIGPNDSAATINPNDNTEVAFTVTLTKPRDFYEFTVDAVNDGTLDGMIDSITSSIKRENGDWEIITSSNLPSYLKYQITYDDEVNIINKHELKAGAKETYKVRLEYRDDINPEDLPSASETIDFKTKAEFVQRDNTSIDRKTTPPYTTKIDVNSLLDKNLSYDIDHDKCVERFKDEFDNNDVELYCTKQTTSTNRSIENDLCKELLTDLIDNNIMINIMCDQEKAPIIITEYNEIYGSTLIIPREIDGAKVISIGDNAFNNKDLTSIELPDTIEFIGDNAFRKNNLTNLTIPTSVKMIGVNAFRDNNVNRLDILDNSTVLNYCAFGPKENIATNNIPDSYICEIEKETNLHEYTITFNKNNNVATGTMNDQEVLEDIAVPLSENKFLLSGYSFIEWNTEPDGSGRSYSDKSNIQVSKDTTLYAIWAHVYKLTLDANGGVLDDTTKDVLEGQEIGELPTPINIGLNFAGWYTGLDSGELVGPNHIVQSNITLYARWVMPQNSYNVTFDKNGDDVIGTMNAQTILEGTATPLTANAYTRNGYSFIGWNTKSDGTGVAYLDEGDIVIIEDTTLYAQWVNYNTLSFMKNNPDATGNDYTVEVLSGVSTRIPDESFNAYTLEGNIIRRWNDESDYSGISYYQNQNITITSDTSLYAEWDELKVTPMIYWALQDNNSDKKNETLIISSYEVYGNKSGSFDGNKFYYDSNEIPWIDGKYYNEKDNLSYNVTNVEIQGVVAPKSTAYWFNGVGFNASSFNANLTNLKTNYVINMRNMFYFAGYRCTTWSIGDLSDWDVSNVTNMDYMFEYAGYSATTWSIGDLSDWDVSNVTNMRYMFDYAGHNSTTWSIGNLSNWETSNVTDMRSMFVSAGYSTTTFDISYIENWDVSNVTDMGSMFARAGYNAKTWSIGDLSDWDTSNVTDMSYMLARTGYSATTFDISYIENWDVSNVTDMSCMFEEAGHSAPTFELDLSGWDTSQVTSMFSMFGRAGYNAKTWSIGDLSNWDTSKVTNMSYMFESAGYSAITWNVGELNKWDTSNVTKIDYMFTDAGCNATTFELDLSGWDTSQVTSMHSMFSNAGHNATTWTIGDLSNWNTSNVAYMHFMFNMYEESDPDPSMTEFNIGNLSKWDTSKVTNMKAMFQRTGANATTWYIGNISNWDTSKVTDMSYMFASAARTVRTINLDLSNWNTSNATNMNYMFDNFGRSSSSFMLVIPKNNRSGINNTTYRMYGKTSSTYASPPSGRSFTVATS